MNGKRGKISIAVWVVCVISMLYGTIMVTSVFQFDAMKCVLQFVYCAIGLMMVWLVSHCTDYNGFRKEYRRLYISSCIVLVIWFLLRYVTVPGTEEVSEDVWIRLGKVALEPVALVFTAVVVASAVLIEKNNKQLSKIGYLLIIPGGIMILGNASRSIYIEAAGVFAIIVVCCYAEAVKDKVITIGISAFFLIANYARTVRVIMLNKDLYGSVLASEHDEMLQAVRRGGVFGNGIGTSTIKKTSSQFSMNMMFGAVGEEVGLAGILVVICLMAVIAVIAVYVAARAKKTKDHLGNVLVVGVAVHWIVALVNMIGGFMVSLCVVRIPFFVPTCDTIIFCAEIGVLLLVLKRNVE